MRASAIFAAVVATLLAACTPDQPQTVDGTWQGTITTEGNVTTVVNESGSVWGGTARLIEEASIGVDVGDDPYMFGYIADLAASEDRIFVLDDQVPVLRTYDFHGVHLGDVGGIGEGPGEYRAPDSVGIDAEGSIFVHDPSQSRILVYSSDGEPLETWVYSTPMRFSEGMVVTETEGPFIAGVLELTRDPLKRQWAMQRLGPDGPLGEPFLVPDFEFDRVQLEARFGRRSSGALIPFYPAVRWGMGQTGAMVAGLSDDYRFEVHNLDGSAIVVHKAWEPVPVQPAEAAWHERYITNSLRLTDPEWTWNGPSIPDHKPAYDALMPGGEGRVWVRRGGPGERLPDCDVEAMPGPGVQVRRCWRSPVLIEVFDETGRYLGKVEGPEGFDLFGPFIRGDMVLTQTMDESGTPMVKRYRLVLPGEE